MNCYSLYNYYSFILKVLPNITDKDGEFVFGPLCPDRCYEVQIWANKVKHHKICANCKHEGKCLKGEKNECCEKPTEPIEPRDEKV